MDAYDFRKAQRKFMPVQLADDIKVRVLMPTLAHVEVFAKMLDAANTIAYEDVDQESCDEALDSIYECFAVIVSCNMELKRFTAEYLRDELEIGPFQIIDFINAYGDFFEAEMTRKN